MTTNTNKSYKDYLDKTFLEELNYKIWTTKGSRFNANKRLLLIYKMSTLSNSLISVYLIAIGLLSVYNLYNNQFIVQNVLPYLATCLAILLLVFNLVENSKNYQLRAKQFHDCGIELSEIYNALRIFKTLKDSPDLNEKERFAERIAAKYEAILKRYDNHDSIDHLLFQTRNPQYFKLSFLGTVFIRLRYFAETQLIYYAVMVLFPVISIIVLFNYQ